MGKQDIVSTLQRLISGIEESIVIFDGNGIILHASEGLKKLFEEKGDLSGRPIFDFIEGKADGVKMWLENLSHAHFKDVKMKMLRHGQPFPARLRMAAWCVSDGTCVVMASVVDGTYIERKKRDLLRKTLTIEQLSKSRKIRNGKLNDAIYEILEMSSKAVKVQRVNAWMFNEGATLIECIGNYDASLPGFVPQESLPRIRMPHYFDLFETEKIILSARSQNSEITKELLDSYLIPNDIHAMMDIPLRIEGEIIGVICFEQTKHARDWSLQDQKFGLIAAQMVSLAVETYKRKLVQQQLENTLRQQQRMMAETNHRIKNNLAITASLMRMQLDKCRDEFHRGLMQDAINRVNSIAALHELLAASDSSHRIRFEPYARLLLDGLKESFNDPDKPIQLVYTIEDCELTSSLAITLGLIINEAVTNSYKHAFNDQPVGMIRVNLELDGANGKLMIADTGKGFSPTMTHGQGFEIIEGLANHIDAKVTTSSEAGSLVTLDFRLR
jgi:two-component sensor histidine kinase